MRESIHIARLMLLAVLSTAPTMSFAKNLKSKDLATATAIEAFKKYQANITTLSVECVTFVEVGPVKGESDMDFKVQEKHGGKCGGDLSTNPLVAYLRVKGEKVFIRDIVNGDYKILNSRYQP